ncbi:hypothetical protein C9374_006261 [Naegleria lovaniensis]|uniref:Uncharacterized protein n=1 Tax=Naegleria lovaniensis TaxID=51637 RepID=A0AA88KHL5_NAELO|nr:uncharacterized protein C9374_006261 [Naegleria lovaniensis]KAG2381272.1 hypothetical protein C9374_006261 [Naegleria lovaniensis]
MKDPSEVLNNEFEFLEWFTKDSFSRVVQEFNKEFDDLLRVVQQREDTAGSLLLRRDDQVLRSERKIDELQAENNELKQQLDDEIISSVRKEESFKESNQSNKNLIASLQSEVKALSAEVTEKEQQIQRLKKAVELKTKENNETITKLENVTQQFTQLQNTHNKMKQDSGTTSEKYRTLYWESDLKRINLEQEMLELKKKLNENQQQLVPQMQHANTGELEGKIVLLQSKLKSSERKKEHYKSLSRGTGKKLLEISNKLKESEEKRVKNLNDLLKKSSENMAYVSKIKELESKLMATQQKVSELEEVCQLSILSKESNEPSKKLQLYKLKKNLQNSEPSHDALLNLRVLEKEHELFMISYEEMKSQLAQLKEFNEFLQSKEKAQTDTNAEDIDFSFVSQTHKELVDRIKVLEGEINVLEERSATSENEAIHFKHLKENAEGALASLTQQYEETRNQLLEQKQHKTEIERALIEKDKENQTLREQCAAQEQAIREIENTLGEKELGNLKLNEEIHTMINLMESAKKERISRKVDQKTSHSQTDEELEETYNAWREKLSTDIHKLKQQFFELSSLKQQEEQIYNNHVYKHKEKIKEILEEKKKLVNEIKDLKKMLKKMKSVKKGLEKSNTLNASEHKPVTQHETLPVSQKTSSNHLLQMSPITEHQSATPSMISELEKEPISMKEIVDDTIIDDTHCEPLNTEEDGNIMIMTPNTIIESVHDLTELDVTNSSSANVSPYEGLSEPVLESYSEVTAERVLSNDQSIESNQQSLETASNQQPFIDPQTIDFDNIPVLNCNNSSNVEQQPPIREASSEDIHDSSSEEMSVYQEEDDSSLTHPRSDNTIPCENTTNANVEDVVNSIENSSFDADNTAFTESSVIENREPKFVDLTQELGTNEEDIVEFRDKEHNENYGSVLDMLPTNENIEHREEDSDDTSQNSSSSSAKYLDSTVSKDQDLPNIEQDKESTNTNLYVLNDTMLPSSQLEEAVEPLEEFADENVLEVSETPYQHIMDERIDSVETCSSQEVSGQSEDQETSNTYQGTTNQEVSLDTMGQTTDTETEVTSSSENVGLKENSSSTLLIHEEVIQTETSIREDEDLRNSDDEENIIQSVINKEEINCSLPEIPSQTNETQEETTDLSHESYNTSENPLCTTGENHLSLSITKYQDLPNIYQEHTNESDNTSPQINAQLEEHSHENVNTLEEILLEEPQHHDSPTQHSATPQNIDQATSALEAVNTWQDDSQEEMSLKHVPHMEDNALEIRSRPENAELIDTDSLEHMTHEETFHPTENIQEFADDENSSVFIDDSFANTLSVGYQSTNEGEIGDDESEVDSEYVFSPIQSSHRDTRDDEDDFLHAIQHLENMSTRIAKETISLKEDIEQKNDKNYETHKVEEGESIDTNVAVLENGQSFENSLDGGNTKDVLVNELNRAITILNSAQENVMPTNTINNDSVLPCSQHDRFASTSELLQLEEDSVVVEPTTTYQNEEHREQIMDLSSLSLNNDSLNVSSSSTIIFNTPTKVVLQDTCVGTQISDMKEVGVETDEQYPLTPPNVVKFENRLHERIKEYEDDESDYFLNIPLPKTATRQVYYYERKYLYLKMRYRQMLEELVKFEIGCRHYKHNVAVLKGDLERAKKTLVSLNKDRHVKEQALLEKISLLSTKLKRTRQLLDKYVHGGGQVL